VGDELRGAILEAAADVFFKEGYEGTSIEAVIERVGGSKRAIYSHFGGKKELFTALVIETSSQVLTALSPSELTSRDLEGTLVAFGRQFLKVVMSPTALALYRTIVSEGTRFPDLAEAFFESGPGRAAARLAVVLDEFRGRREVDVEDSGRAAEHFIGMLRDDLYLRVVLGLRRPPSAAEIDVFVRQATTIFVEGCRTKSSKKQQPRRH
jgi:AcrR family transcriptional regulator